METFQAQEYCGQREIIDWRFARPTLPPRAYEYRKFGAHWQSCLDQPAPADKPTEFKYNASQPACRENAI